MSPIEFLYISLGDLIKSECFNIKDVIATIEDVFIDYKKGNVLLPDKISQIFDEETQNRINCMPATLIDKKISGVKWVSVFPGNPQLYNMPNVSGMIILSELERGFPFTVMDGSLITALRTACIGAIGAKYLSKKNSESIGFIGAGEQAKMHFMSIYEVRPEIKYCKVASRTVESEEKFINELKSMYKDVCFEKCNGDFEKASSDSDIIVTAISAQEPLLKAHTIKKGAFYCHVGGWEDEYAVPLKADKIICDQWESIKHRTQTISRMYKSGLLMDSDIYADIVDIIDGTLKGRENEDEFIYFNSVGLAFIDVAVAYSMYKKVKDKDLGIELTLQSKSILDYLYEVGE